MPEEGTRLSYVIKDASYRRYLASAGLLGGLGALYGMGDTKHNYANELLHDSTGQRASQGAISGLAGAGGYSLARALGRGRAVSGLAALLSAGGAASLANPKLSKEDPYRLPF